MSQWFRVFGSSEAGPGPEALADHLRGSGFPAVAVQFHGDEQGWFRADLLAAPDLPPLRLERFLSTEAGIRDELNAWAAWLETTGSPHRDRLMEHTIGTRQVFTLEQTRDEAGVAELCVAVCRFLARATGGVYQVDGRGFFDAEGTLLAAEEAEESP